MAREGWSAEGLLQPLWEQYRGDRRKGELLRDAVARAAGTQGSVLSAINTGNRNLGRNLAPRLAAALGVSVLELGAPLEEADEVGQTLVTRLEELAADLAEAAREQAKLSGQVTRLQERVRRLEARPSPAEARPTDQAVDG